MVCMDGVPWTHGLRGWGPSNLDFAVLPAHCTARAPLGMSQEQQNCSGLCGNGRMKWEFIFPRFPYQEIHEVAGWVWGNLQSFHHIDGWMDRVAWSMFKALIKSGLHSLQQFPAALGNHSQPLQTWCGGMTLAGSHRASKAAPSLPTLAGQGRENLMEGWRSGQGRITQELLSWAERSQLGEMDFICCKSNWSSVMRKKLWI